MNVIACVDDCMGLLFNNRRQSKDSQINKKIREIIGNHVLWINSFSKILFPEAKISEHFLEEAKEGDYCFIENIQVPEEKVEKLYLFKWNRTYPYDFTLNLPINTYTLIHTEEFEGTSHKKITLEVFKR